uniref:Uncharacterized protein n=1 Tax=Piura virus TaxID=1170425 RepID=A0A1U7EJ02_9VIRU|nr:hypothetical protein 1 [Piura virus]
MTSSSVPTTFDDHTRNAILDQLRQNTSMDYGAMQENVKTAMLKQIIASEQTKEIFVAAAFNEATQALDAKSSQEKIVVHQRLSKEDQDRLRKTFCMFSLDFSRATDCASHAFWRAHRFLSERKMLRAAGIKPCSRPCNGYDVVYKDVGGNPTTHLNRGELYVHTCAPLLSNNDDKRHSAYKERLRRGNPRFKNLVYEKHVNGDSQVICNRRSENCSIKAEVLIFLHSSYDMSLGNIADAMHRANARTAYGVFHFNPRVLYEKRGKLLNGMCFEKRVVNGRVKIRFWYENDCQEGYEHDYIRYVSLLRTFRIQSSSDKPRYYNVQFDTSDDDTAFFIIRQSISGDIPASNCFRVFTNESLEGKLLLYTWEWSTLNSGTFSSSTLSRMKPVRLIIEEKLYNKGMAFAATLPDSKLSVKNILIALTSFNSREVISGQNIGVVDPTDPYTVRLLAVTIFMLTYVQNYEGSKCLSNLMRDEDRVREESDSGFFVRLFRIKVRLPWNHRVQKFRGRMDELRSEIQSFEDKLSVVDDLTTSNIKRMITEFKSWTDVERRFEMHIDHMCNFLTINQELDCLLMDASPCDRGFVSYSPVVDIVDTNSIREAALNAYESVKTADTSYDSGSYKIDNCVVDLAPVPNSSNGHCVFQSMIDSGVELNVEQLRLRLAASPFMVNLRHASLQRDLLNCMDGSEKGYGDLDTFILFSLEFQQGVCVHVDGLCKTFGPPPLKHFEIKEKHCTFLKLCHTFDAIPSYSLSTLDDKEKFEYDSCARDAMFDAFFDLKSQFPSNNVYKQRLAAAKRNYCPLSELGNGNYLCRSGLKTAEMFARYFDEKLNSAVTIGGPGGEAQFLCNKGIRTFGITKISLIDFSPALSNYHHFTQLTGDEYDGDIMRMSNILSFRASVRAVYPAGVDFFGGDAATASDHDSQVDSGEMVELISWEVVCMSVLLRKGGDAYFKVFGLLEHGMPRIVMVLNRIFSSMQIVKLETSRAASTELHIICKDYQLEDDIPSYVYSRLIESSVLPVPTGIVMNCRHAQKMFDSFIIKGLRQYEMAFNTIGTSNELINRFPSSKIEGYRSVLCLPSRITAGGITDAVRRTFRKIYNVDSDRDYLAELRDFKYVVEIPEPAPSDVNVAHAALDWEPEEGLLFAEVPESANVVKKIFARNRSDPFLTSTEKDGSFTVIGETRHTGITYDAPKVDVPRVDFDIARKTSGEVADVPAAIAGPSKTKLHKLAPSDAMIECLELTKCTLSTHVSNHSRLLRKLDQIPMKSSFVREESGVYSYCEYRKDTGPTLLFGAAIANRSFNKFFFSDGFHSMKDIDRVMIDGGRFLLSEYCEIAIEQELIETYSSVDIRGFKMPDGVGIVQAGPGCGKTTFVVNNSIPPHMPGATNVILSTVEGKDDFIRRIEKKYKVTLTKEQLVYIRTMASFLVNPKKNAFSDLLIIDEALMAHPGQLFFAIAISRAKEVKLLGDCLQIPYVNRTPAFVTKCHRLIDFVPVVETLYISYRCPTDVAARLDKKYLAHNRPNGVDRGLMSTRFSLNTCKVIKLSNDNFPKDPEIQYLVFTQAEKQKLLLHKLQVSTVHEYQGKESKRIRVVRLNPYPQDEIYKRENYALVALTRHTESLEYYTRVTSDALSQMIKVDGVTCHVAMSEDENRRCFHVSAGAIEHEVFRVANSSPNPMLSTITVVPTPISAIKEPRLYFVPRFGRKDDCKFKPLVMQSDFSIQTRNGVVNIFVVSSDHPAQKHNLKTITRNLKSLSPTISRIGMPRIFVAGSVENDIERSAVGLVLYKNIRSKAVLCSTVNQYDVPREVFDLLTKNGICSSPNSTFTSTTFIEPDASFIFEIERDFDVTTAQHFITSFFGECAYVEQAYDAWDVRNSPLNIEVGRVQFNPVVCVQLNREFDMMRPVLYTPMPFMRDYNCREIMLALEKRNRNVPNMNGIVDFDEGSSAMLESLIRECFDEKLLKFHLKERVAVSMNSVYEWLSKQPTGTKELIVPDFALHQSALNSYTFSIKRKPKPNLTVDATKSYLALQTIVYHEKPINAMFCSIFREIKSRVTMSLKRHVKIFCDMSAEDFEDVLNRDIPPSSLSACIDKLEIDISKYDKSQRELALDFECKLMSYFGVDADIVELWFNAHVLTEVYDKTTKMKALIPYQRKSGDASTFIGNTLFLMAVVCDLIPVSELELALFSGDDSLLYGHDMNRYRDSQHFGLKFNLEIKFFEFELSYFCSKFLLVVRDRWTFTPDPVKFMTKLGRHDLVNPLHVEEYRISFVDTVRNYRSYHVCKAVAVALRERYGIRTDHTAFLMTLHSMTSLTNFPKLFYSIDGDRIDYSIVFSRDF